mmetsp:Transcript_54414/g.142230  ORF Transcript_54414/g.142230 Transcript_54414/m.142230 type:complete len:220 (+) Transcript_54414:92-751(+)
MLQHVPAKVLLLPRVAVDVLLPVLEAPGRLLSTQHQLCLRRRMLVPQCKADQRVLRTSLTLVVAQPLAAARGRRRAASSWHFHCSRDVGSRLRHLCLGCSKFHRSNSQHSVACKQEGGTWVVAAAQVTEELVLLQEVPWGLQVPLPLQRPHHRQAASGDENLPSKVWDVRPQQEHGWLTAVGHCFAHYPLRNLTPFASKDDRNRSASVSAAWTQNASRS